MVYLNIYHRDIGLSKWYQQGYFRFHWLEIRQVQNVVEKKIKRNWKTYSYFNGLGNFSQNLFDREKTYPEDPDHRNCFLAT